MAVYLIESFDEDDDAYKDFVPADENQFIDVYDVKKLNNRPIPLVITENGLAFTFRNHQFFLNDFVTAMYDEVPAYITGVDDETLSFPLYIEELSPNLSDEEIDNRNLQHYLRISYPESDDYGYVNLYKKLDTTHKQSIKDFRNELPDWL